MTRAEVQKELDQFLSEPAAFLSEYSAFQLVVAICECDEIEQDSGDVFWREAKIQQVVGKFQ